MYRDADQIWEIKTHRVPEVPPTTSARRRFRRKIVVALLLFILCEDMMEKMAGTLLSFNGITMPAVMPIALTRMDFGPLNDF